MVLQDDGHIAKITGEVGTGKTMLCRKVLNALEVLKDRYLTAFIPNPVLSEEGIMRALADELNITVDPETNYYGVLKLITEKLLELSAKQKSVVLFIDEAQAMPEETLEAIRLLTTIEQDPEIGARLQVVLFGQPELDQLLERPLLRELNKDISLSYQLTALDRDGVKAYLNHRLIKAGYNGSDMFTDKAIELIFKGSGGIPRLINILAHKTLMVGFGKGAQTLTDKHVEEAVKDTEAAQQQKSITEKLFPN
jgi:MSHA biogenesis protein MshM